MKKSEAIEKINKKYIDLCSEFGLDVSINREESPSLPGCSVADTDGKKLITVNTALISEDEYESFLAYSVGKLLLPNLVLETERLTVRRFRPEDSVDCLELVSDEQGSYMDCCKPISEMNEEFAQLMELFAERDGQYVLVLRESGKVIGTVHVFDDDSRAVETKEIGYAVSPSYRRSGYAFEALTAIIKLLCEDLHTELIVAGVLEENIPSAKLLEKLGFVREGLRRKCTWHEGLNKPVDLIYYYRDR